MAVHVKPGTKLLMLLLALLATYFIYYRANEPSSGTAEVRTSSGALTAGLDAKTHFKLALSQWPGHMPFVVANGGLTTQPGSASAAHDLDLEIVFIEDTAAKNAALRDGNVDFVWQTVDELPINLGAFKKTATEVRAFLQLDWSRGGDACVAAQEVRKVEDLIGRKSAMLMFSPDHTVFEFMINNSRLTHAQIGKVRENTSFSSDDFTYGRTLFTEGKVDVACLWEPDVSLALKSRTGSHVLFSTADATSLVADVVIANKALLADRPEIARKLAAVWFAGMAQAEADRAAAARLISTLAPRFRDELGYEATLQAFEWVKWTGLGDNAHFFGIDGDPPAFDRVYKQADEVWTNYPEAKIAERFVPATLRDDSVVRGMWEAGGRPGKPEQPSYEPKIAQNGTPLFTKPVTVNYAKSSADLDAESMYILNSQILPQLELARAMHIRIEGNTDSNGSSELNRELSELRAKAVRDYFISRGVEPSRISHKGNGDTAPVASNKTTDGRAANRRTDILFIKALEK